MSKQALMAAAMAKLKAESIESMATVDVMLNNASGIADNPNYVEELVSHAKNIYICEAAARKIQETYAPKPAPAATPPRQQPSPAQAQRQVTVKNSDE